MQLDNSKAQSLNIPLTKTPSDKVAVIDVESKDGIPYIVAIQTRGHGCESYLVEEGIAIVPNGTLTKITRPHSRTYSLEQIFDRLRQLQSQGYQFYAFGASQERRIFDQIIGIADLQEQKFWLIAKPEDHSVAHNAYDEVKFLMGMISYDIDPQGITWTAALTDGEAREHYNAMLTRFGYNPISINGTASIIHGSGDWCIGLSNPITHSRDVIAMKWKLYIFCLQRQFTREHFHILERFAQDKIGLNWSLAWSTMDFARFPFPQLTVMNFNLYYAKLQDQFQSCSLQVGSQQPTQMNKQQVKLHNRVRNGDLAAIQTDDSGAYTLGDESQIKWELHFKSFFKRISGCINAEKNGSKNEDFSDAWQSAVIAMGSNQKFFLEKSHLWPAEVLLDSQSREIFCKIQTYAGRKAPSQSNGGYPEIDQLEASKCFEKPFPPSCEHVSYDSSYRKTNYRLGIQQLVEKGCAYQQPGSQIIIVSPPDGLCFFKALAHFAYEEPQIEHDACEMAYLQAYCTAKGEAQDKQAAKAQGHDEHIISLVTSALGVSYMHYDQFVKTVSMISERDLEHKTVSRSQTPLFPCIVLHKSHACVAVLKKHSNKKLFSYRQLDAAFAAPRKERKGIAQKFHEDCVRIENNAQTRAKKLKRAVEKQRADFAKEKQRMREEVQKAKKCAKMVGGKAVVNLTPEELIHRQIHYCLRKELQVDPANLPNTHDGDALIAKYVLDYQLGLNRDVNVPIPESRTGYVYLASLQKRKQNDIFQPEPPRTVITHTLKSEVLGQITEPQNAQVTAIVDLACDQAESEGAENLDRVKICESLYATGRPDGGKIYGSRLQLQSPGFGNEAVLVACVAASMIACIVAESYRTSSSNNPSTKIVHPLEENNKYVQDRGVVITKKRVKFDVVTEDQSDIEMKQVNAMAVFEATAALVLSTHTSPNGRVTNNEAGQARFNPFVIQPHKFGVDGLKLNPIRVNVQGSLPPNFYDWVTLYGMDLHPDSKKVASHTSGGHSALRTFVNLLIAQHWNEVISQCLRVRDPLDHPTVTIVCPGDKYAKTTSILDGCFMYDPNIWYPIQDDQNRGHVDTMNRLRRHFKEDEATARAQGEANNWTNHETNHAFLITHALRQNCNTEAIRLCQGRREIIHRSVRPVENSYDKRYHEMNFVNCLQKKWRPGFIDHEYVRGYIEEHDEVLPNSKVIYSLIDVHYYLSDWTPANVKPGDWYNAVGGNFFPTPGRYLLPFNEGVYLIDSQSRVLFRPRRSGTWYQHPLVTLRNADFCINFGWYSLVQASGHSGDLSIHRFAPTGFNTTNSVQSTWILEQMQNLKGTKIASMIEAGLTPQWTEADTLNFRLSLARSEEFESLSHDNQIQIFSYFQKAYAIRKFEYDLNERMWPLQWMDAIFGHRVLVSYRDYLAPNAMDSDQRMTDHQYEEAKQEEWNGGGDVSWYGTMNRPGLIGYMTLFRYMKPIVPEIQVKRINNKSNGWIWNPPPDRPSAIETSEFRNEDELTMIYCGRSSTPQQEEELAPRGQELLVHCQQGRADWKCAMDQYASSIRAPKLEKFKVVNFDSDTTIQMEGYYCIKRPDFASLEDINPEVIRSPGLYMQQMGAAIKLVASQTERMAIYKNQLVPFEKVVAGKVVSMSGFQVLSKAMNLPIREFEWSTKSLDNKLGALQRHLSAKQRPDPRCLRDFGDMTRVFMDDLMSKIYSENPQPRGFLMDYPSGQDGWTNFKKLKYEKNIMRVFWDETYRDYLESFTLMVKSGEVCTTIEMDLDQDGYLTGQKSRSRAIMNPTPGAFGIMQAVQSEIFPLLKKHVPGFIHSMTSSEIVDLIRSRIGQDWKAISIDGSAFDSSQFESIMRLVDDRFWKGMRPFIRSIILHNWNAMLNMPNNTVDQITDQLMRALLKSQNLVFVHLPGVNAPRWSEDVKKRFFKQVESSGKWTETGPEVDWIFLELSGTTFSGHSTKTTLGNTLRTLCYIWYYTIVAGVSNCPWDSDVIFAIASGDDGVAFVAPEFADALYACILDLSTRDTTAQQLGLGQCIKEIKIGNFHDIEFCSKWSDSPDGTLGSWKMCRSVEKLMTTKQYFTGRNKHILSDPYLHRLAILQGFESEKVSMLIEDMLTIQLQSLKRPNISIHGLQSRLGQTKQIKYALDPSDYLMERYVNDRMGYTLKDLWNLKMEKRVYAGRTRHCPEHINNMNKRDDSGRQDKSLKPHLQNQGLSSKGKQMRLAQQLLQLRASQNKAQKKNKTHKRTQPRVGDVQVTKPSFDKGMLQQKQHTSQVMTAWDEQLVAKCHPGQFNVPYVAGMNVTNLPTNCFSVSNTISDANRYLQDHDEPLGTSKYTLIMWSSSMTAFRGDGESGNLSESDKLGGMVVKMVDEADLDTPFIYRGVFNKAQSAYTMLEVYGSDMTKFSAGGFSWASEATFNVLAPAANMVGSFYRGTIQFGQLPTGKAGQMLSLKQLIEIAGDIEVMKPQFHLRTGVVNHDIVYESQQYLGDGLMENQFVGELVNYVVLQDVAKDITTGKNAEFSLMFNIKGNGVFWGNPEDSIANNLFKTNRQSKSPMPGVLASVQQNPDVKITKKPSSLWEGAKFLLSKAWENRGSIMTAAQSLAPLLLLSPEDEDVENVAIKVNYLASLMDASNGLAALSRQNPFLDIKAFQEQLALESERVRAHHGRLIPLEPIEKQADAKDLPHSDPQQVSARGTPRKK